MATYENFKIWFAESTANNTFDDAADNLKIQNRSDVAGEEIKLIYCNPTQFSKRVTDVSNVLAIDKTAPDTGSAGNFVTLRFTQQREQSGEPTIPVLFQLLQMYFTIQTDGGGFQKGRIGLENSDNPQLDCLPIQLAGYKMLRFRQEPNDNSPALKIYEVDLEFLGDDAALGTRSTSPLTANVSSLKTKMPSLRIGLSALKTKLDSLKIRSA